jgi:hypothetical protein
MVSAADDVVANAARTEIAPQHAIAVWLRVMALLSI